jgi:hypothetical protein
MNEPQSRKVKYDYGVQMTDTHKARASEPKSIGLPSDTQFVQTRTATAVETNGKTRDRQSLRARSRASVVGD